MSGGYVGVDIFFVISGYLITAIIVSEKKSGSFTLKNFYERRIRRILPALFTVSIIFAIPAWLFMLPDELKSFSQSLVAVSLFASNFLFWRTTGYFDATAEDNPLLHTWSIGVEEQYYLFFPIFIILLWSFSHKRIIWTILAFALISLLLCEYGWRHHSGANFYFPLTRAWEFLIGSFIALISFYRPLYHYVSQKFNEILAGLGLLLILFALFIFNKNTPSPSLYSLIPTIGAALIIAFANKETFVAKILSLKWIVAIGLISYSAYLWHQPLFVLARLSSINQLPQYVFGILILGVFFLAYLTWRYVEKPFRDRTYFSSKQIFVSAITISLMMIGIGLFGYFTNGFIKHYSAAQQQLLSFHYNYQNEYRQGLCFLRDTQDKSAFGHCFDAKQTNHQSVVLWGDSHAAHLYPGLKKILAQNFNIIQLTAGGCPPMLNVSIMERPYCREINDYVFERIKKERPDRVILAAMWTRYKWKNLKYTILKLHEAGVRRIDIVGPVPQWKRGLPKVLIRFNKKFANLPRRTKKGLIPGIKKVDREMKVFFANIGVNYISPISLLCNANGCLTRIGDSPDFLTAWDYGHLTSAGSTFLISRFPN